MIFIDNFFNATLRFIIRNVAANHRQIFSFPSQLISKFCWMIPTFSCEMKCRMYIWGKTTVEFSKPKAKLHMKPGAQKFRRPIVVSDLLALLACCPSWLLSLDIRQSHNRTSNGLKSEGLTTSFELVSLGRDASRSTSVKEGRWSGQS